jgi:hypothetical protein
MLRFLVAALLGLSFLAASPAEAKLSPQQQKFQACSKAWPDYMRSNGLKGKDRKAYMASCLKAS